MSPSLPDIFKAFSDETRLRVLNLLVQGELCVCDIMGALKVRQSKVSRHLAHLKRAGLVKARRQGTWMHYSLAQNGKAGDALLKCLKDLAPGVPPLAKDRAALRSLARDKVRCD